jgi:hypothetical protein
MRRAEREEWRGERASKGNWVLKEINSRSWWRRRKKALSYSLAARASVCAWIYEFLFMFVHSANVELGDYSFPFLLQDITNDL